MGNTMATTDTTLTGERADLLQALGNARHFLRLTARELDDEQAATRTTVSELSIGGLIKHVANTERQWQHFAIHGQSAMGWDDVNWDGSDFSTIPAEVAEAFANEFRMLPGDTLTGLLKGYARIAEATDALLADLNLDTVHELPRAPWFVDTHWSVRRALLHIVAETTQHAGHADIIRESLDGAKSMG